MEFSIPPNRARKHCLRLVIKILNTVLNVSNWRVRTVEKSIPPHRAVAFIWKNFISPYWDPGRINRDLSKAGWLTSHMNISYFYKRFLTIARSRLSGPARLHMNSPLMMWCMESNSKCSTRAQGRGGGCGVYGGGQKFTEIDIMG